MLDGLTMLEHADDQLADSYARETEQLRAEPVNRLGQVRLAQDANIGTMLADPVERENRLARARRAAPGSYDGDEGRERFLDDDRLHLEAGLDMVRTFERAGELRAANGHRAQQRRELDQQIEAAHGARGQVRALDSQIANLRDQRDGLAPRTTDPVGHQATRLRLLETGNSEILSLDLQQRVIELGHQRPDLSYAERRRRVIEQAELGAPLTDKDEAAARRQGPLTSLVAAPAVPDDTPAGVDPASHALEQRVRERLRRNGHTGPSVTSDAYIKALEQIMAEDTGRSA